MKIVRYRPAWGNIKMRGRKYCGLSCLCCVIFNEKDKILDKIIKKEIKDYVNV